MHLRSRLTRLLATTLLFAAACDNGATGPDDEPTYRTEGDVGTYQYFFLDSYRPLVVDDERPPQMSGELWIYDADGGVPQHIDEYVMEPRPDSVIVTESFPIEYSSTESISLGVTGTEAKFRLMVVGLDGWVARTEGRRETFDCVEMTPDGIELTASTNHGEDTRSVDWETLESHGEPQLLVIPVRTNDGAATGDAGQRLVGYGLAKGCR